tara:strand:- start:425 stop:700 length:276 start_codon:yes stop_codon:yes gene_type:complete
MANQKLETTVLKSKLDVAIDSLQLIVQMHYDGITTVSKTRLNRYELAISSLTCAQTRQHPTKNKSLGIEINYDPEQRDYLKEERSRERRCS